MNILGMTPTEQTAWLVAITGGLSTFFTLICTKGIDAFLKWRADKRIDEVREEEGEDIDLKFIINRQDTVINAMNEEMKELRREHIDCERKHAELKARLEMLETRVANQGG